MKAIVLIGGLGTRLRPLTYDMPKQLIPLAGRPVLYHALDLLPEGTEEAALATGYKAEEISAYVRDHPYRFPLRTIPEAEPLGTGGGMRNAGDATSDPFFLLNSDVIAETRMEALRQAQEHHHGIGAMLLSRTSETQSFGVAALGPDDRITAFVEKPGPGEAPSEWVNAGLAVWRREVLDRIPRGRPVSFEREIVPGLLEQGVYGVKSTGYWQDAGTPDRVLHAQRLLFDAGRGGALGRPPGSLGDGPVSTGPETTAAGATIGPYVTLGAGVRVAAGARVSNAIVMDGAEIGAGATVIGTLVGPGAQVAAGARVFDGVIGRTSASGLTPPAP